MTKPAKSAGMFKPGYDGDQPSPRLTPMERESFEARGEKLESRLLTAMMVLSSMDRDAGAGGKGSNWPAYVHTVEDMEGWEDDPKAAPPPFEPTPAQLSDFVPAMALLDGLLPIYPKVLFLRALARHYGLDVSWASIGERYGRSGDWAKRTYEAVLIQAARRCGVLPPAPHGWAVLVAAVDVDRTIQTYLTTAADPAAQLRDLRAKSPLRVMAAYAVWTPGQAAAKALIDAARKQHLSRKAHGSWHILTPSEVIDGLVDKARAANIGWSIEPLPINGAVVHLPDGQDGRDL